MERFFGKKREKPPKPPQQPISPSKSSNVATGSPVFRAEQDDDVNGKHNYCRLDSWVGFHGDLTTEADNRSNSGSRIANEDEAPVFRVSDLGIDGTGYAHEPASEFFSSLRLGPILTQVSRSLRNRRGGR